MNLLEFGLCLLVLWLLWYVTRAIQAANRISQINSTRHVREQLVLIQARALAPRIAARIAHEREWAKS